MTTQVTQKDQDLAQDDRVCVPLYTIAEAARFLGVPAATLATWARGYERHPRGRSPTKQPAIITSISAGRGQPSIPFAGLAEAMVLAAFRRSGVSLQHIRRAVTRLEREIGIDHALASKRLYTDGAAILYEYADKVDDREIGDLIEIVSGQRVFTGVVRDYITRIGYDTAGWAVRLTLPLTKRHIVTVDPAISFGQPVFGAANVRFEDVIDRWKAGEALGDIANDYEIPFADLEDAIRATYPAAA